MKAELTTTALIEMLYERIPELFDKPKREWVGLTDEEVEDVYRIVRPNVMEFWRQCEAKLKEKNS